MRAFLLAGLFSVLFASSALAEGALALRASGEVDRAVIRLADVFDGISPEADREIAMAPVPGKSVTYDAVVLTKLAQRHNLDWKPQGYGDRIILTRAATHITQEMIRAAVMEKLQEKKLRGKLDVFFDRKALEVVLPAGLEPSFVLNNFNYDANGKRFRAELVAETGAAPVVLPITGRVKIERDVPVLARRLVAGTVIGRGDVDWVAMDEDRVTVDTITEEDQLLGRAVRRDTAEGSPLRTREVMPPRLVTRGSLVTMKIETPSLLITAQGKAMQDGAAGEIVRVTNVQSNRVVEGVVDGAGIVRIVTSQQQVASAE